MRPNDHFAHYLLGVHQFGSRRWAEAKQELQISLQLRPSYPDPYRWLARMARRAGKPYEAIRYAEKGVELAPDAAHMLNQAASQHAFNGNFSKAASYFKRANELKPGEYDVQIGWIALLQRKLPLAITHLEKGGANPGLLGLAYRFAGEDLKAEQKFRDSIRLNENSTSIRSRYHALLSKCHLGRVKDPGPQLEELSKIPWESVRPTARLRNIADIHAAAGNSNLAIDAIEEFMKFNVYSPKFIAAGPGFDNLKDNPRFIELVNQPWPAVTIK